MADDKPSGLREGIMGGTFDPVHLGHLLIARSALEELGLDRVIFLPDGDPPHKRPLSSRDDRLLMACLACADEPRFAVSDMELRREGRTYTVDTLRALKQQDAAAELTYLVGSDTFLVFPTWRTADRVAQLCRMAIVLRPGDDPAAVESARREYLCRYGLESRLLSRPGLPLSSSLVRRAAQAGQPLEGLVPKAVADYIRQKGLYGIPGSSPGQIAT